MVCRAMRVRWNAYGVRLSWFALLILILEIQRCWSLNSEGLALLEFRARVDYDPYLAFANWNPYDYDPCMWTGIHCIDGTVQMLNLSGFFLKGVLAPELGKLTQLRSLVLHKNRFFGAIPKEIGGLKMLEELDLRDNNLSGTIPEEIGGLQSLKRLLLCNNKFEGSVPLELEKLNVLSELQFDENLTFAATAEISCVNRKFGHCIWQDSFKQFNRADSFLISIKETLLSYINLFPFYVLSRLKFGKDSLHHNAYNCCDTLSSPSETLTDQNVQNLVHFVRRRLLQQSSNLAAAPAGDEPPPEQIIALPSTRSSGSFPAVPNGKSGQSHSPAPSPSDPLVQQTNGSTNSDGQSSETDKSSHKQTSGSTWKYIVASSGGFLLLLALAMLCICRNKAVSTIGPWKTGISGQLQKAFVTGVPNLNSAELETACEDFSNIIEAHQAYTIYKGTLSSGVEIAVVSTAITSVKDWSKRSEMAYRKKIDTLSRVNHKNFVNLIGYSEEDEPFFRMLVFEYAPNGTLSEHLHVPELEHLDWNARTRIIMGTAYCLQYMHDLNPPVAHTNLVSSSIYLTDDYAAKIAEICFSADVPSKPAESESDHSELPPPADPETNVYSFGILLLEIISGKPTYTEEQGPLVNWASEYLNDKQSISYMIDPTLKSFKNNELEIICEVIGDCLQPDAMKRPTMKEVTSKLREVIAITPDSATPRLSPLWWAELEILSSEAN